MCTDIHKLMHNSCWQEFMWKLLLFHTDMVSSEFLWKMCFFRGELQVDYAKKTKQNKKQKQKTKIKQTNKKNDYVLPFLQMINTFCTS